MRFSYSVGIAILSFSILSAAPSLASSKLVEESAVNSTLRAEPVKLAGFLDGINDIVNTGGRVLDRVETERVRQEEREREEARLETERARQAAIEAERLAAAEERRLMIEQQRIMFQSMTPEQQQSYIAEQQRLQAEAQQRQVDQLNGLAELALPFLFGGSAEGTAPSSSDGSGYTYYPDNSPRPSQQTPARPTPPIDPFYGNGPAY